MTSPKIYCHLESAAIGHFEVVVGMQFHESLKVTSSPSIHTRPGFNQQQTRGVVTLNVNTTVQILPSPPATRCSDNRNRTEFNERPCTEFK